METQGGGTAAGNRELHRARPAESIHSSDAQIADLLCFALRETEIDSGDTFWGDKTNMGTICSQKLTLKDKPTYRDILCSRNYPQMPIRKLKIHFPFGGQVAHHRNRSDSDDFVYADEMSSVSSSDMDQNTLEIKHGDMAAVEEEMQLMSSGSGNIWDADKMSSGRSDMNQPFTPEIKHGDITEDEEEDEEEEDEEVEEEDEDKIPEREEGFYDWDLVLTEPNLTWEKKVLRVLNMIRCRDLIEFNRKLHCYEPTRFCEFNIAFFDLDKESEVKHGPLFCDIPESDYWRLDGSINIISIKVAESEVSGTINIYGTVLARDRYDYRCVYLFKRGRDDAQPISSEDNTLTLTGPNRALAGLGSMYFEFHLKIKGEEAVDYDFSKGLIVRNSCCDSRRPKTLSLQSCLSKVDMLYMPVSSAVEASLGVNILNGISIFNGKVTARTTNDENEIILYDSEVVGTETKLGNGGSVKLTRRVVSVPRLEKLMLRFTVSEGDHKSLTFLLPLGKGVERFTTKLGPYNLQFKIIWKGVFRQRPNLFEDFGDSFVLR